MAPLNLAAQIARRTGDKILATSIVERPWPPKGGAGEDEYLKYVSAQASQSLEQMVSKLPADVGISVLVHQSTSVPTGLTDLAAAQQADLVVVGSSSSGNVNITSLTSSGSVASEVCASSVCTNAVKLVVVGGGGGGGGGTTVELELPPPQPASAAAMRIGASRCFIALTSPRCRWRRSANRAAES